MQRSKRQTVSTVFPGRKAVETASVLLSFSTRLKPGVNERSRLHSASTRARCPVSPYCCTTCESNAPSVLGELLNMAQPQVVEIRRLVSPAPTPQALAWDRCNNKLWMGSRDL